MKNYIRFFLEFSPYAMICSQCLVKCCVAKKMKQLFLSVEFIGKRSFFDYLRGIK